MKRLPAVILIVMVLLIVASLAPAQNSELQLPWSRVAGGGGTSGDGGRFSLSGTIGQAEAGVMSDGGNFALSGGYWHEANLDPVDASVYLPLVIRPD